MQFVHSTSCVFVESTPSVHAMRLQQNPQGKPRLNVRILELGTGVGHPGLQASSINHQYILLFNDECSSIPEFPWTSTPHNLLSFNKYSAFLVRTKVGDLGFPHIIFNLSCYYLCILTPIPQMGDRELQWFTTFWEMALQCTCLKWLILYFPPFVETSWHLPCPAPLGSHISSLILLNSKEYKSNFFSQIC